MASREALFSEDELAAMEGGAKEEALTGKARVKAEKEYARFLPGEFEQDPFGYFEEVGVNVKENSKQDFSEKHLASLEKVKDFPNWVDEAGNEIEVVGKKIRVDKSEVGKSGDPFYEYRVIKMVRELGLPGPVPIAKAAKGEDHLIVMERLQGYRTMSPDRERLRQESVTDEDYDDLVKQIMEKLEEMKQRYAEAGIVRAWKPKDMIYDIDTKKKKIVGVTPTDWERTHIDMDKYNAALERVNSERK
ncbi:hypothetical protein ACFL2D_01240 [Patescibacteria group bacterium]